VRKRKHFVTRCRVPGATLCDVDDSWQQLEHLHERIRWARMRWAERQGDSFSRPTDAARSLGVKPGTYRTWEQPKESGGREPSRSEVSRLAEKFKVSWLWLSTGTGSPYFDPALEAQLNIFQQKAAMIEEPKDRDAAIRAALSVLDSFTRKAG
jgi:transcriptional regulator with XRE-family HTH domain